MQYHYVLLPDNWCYSENSIFCKKNKKQPKGSLGILTIECSENFEGLIEKICIRGKSLLSCTVGAYCIEKNESCH